MGKGTSLPDADTQVHARETGHRSRASRGIAIVLWVIGLLILAVASVFTHNHPDPWSFELAFSRTVQHLPYWSWVPPLLDFFGTFNNPTPTGIVLGIVFAAILLLGWYRQAFFLALTVGIGNGIDALIGDYVVRPRPSANLVHVDVLLKYNSFPSGHCCHAILFYGFLLYLSFTEPVRTWRYRWALLPLQIIAVLNVLLVGFSRVYEGEHWISDILAGYLSGALWLALFIVLYQWTTNLLQRRRAKKVATHSMAIRGA